MENSSRKKIYDGVFRIVLVLIASSIIFSLGFLVGRDGLSFTLKGKNLGFGSVSSTKPREVDFDIFWQAWNEVKKNYLGDTSDERMIQGAIAGMVNSLNDPYTIYLPADIDKQFRDDIKGEFQGIGVEIGLRDDKITIIAPIAGSPAEKAGIKSQDRIIGVNDEPTEGLYLDEVVQKIRGKAGTQVKLTISREGVQKPIEIQITRETIYIKSVNFEMKDGSIAYIKVSQFNEDTYGFFEKALEDAKTKGAKGIVIDLRNNPGGLLQTAIDTTSLVIKPGVVVKRKYKNGSIESDRTTQTAICLNTKMVILINEGSASASEIFAGALQDTKRATLVGQKTYGKGSVQDLTQLSNNASIKITIANWLTPKGRVIDKKGIEPDVKVKEDEDDKTDLQLGKALEIIKQ